MQKNLRDQIIEGLSNGDTVEALLQEADLMLDRTISKCQAQEAAKNNEPPSQMITRNQFQLYRKLETEEPSPHRPQLYHLHYVQVVEPLHTLVVGLTALPTTRLAIIVRKLAIMLKFARVSPQDTMTHHILSAHCRQSNPLCPTSTMLLAQIKHH